MAKSDAAKRRAVAKAKRELAKAVKDGLVNKENVPADLLNKKVEQVVLTIYCHHCNCDMYSLKKNKLDYHMKNKGEGGHRLTPDSLEPLFDLSRYRFRNSFVYMDCVVCGHRTVFNQLVDGSYIFHTREKGIQPDVPRNSDGARFKRTGFYDPADASDRFRRSFCRSAPKTK